MSEFEELEKMISAALGGLGLKLYQYTFTGHVVRVVIDKDGGEVSVEDCADASRVVEKLFDERNFSAHNYTLEVSSPGLERPLATREDYARYPGKKVRLIVNEDNKQLAVMGWIRTVADAGVELEFKNREIKIYPFDQIISGKLEVDFNRRK
jgi:ribosome maturation factor RimP